MKTPSMGDRSLMRMHSLRVLPCLVLAALRLSLTGADASSGDRLRNPPDSALRSQFLNPSPETRPGCYWYWLDNHVTKEGITKDLEAMSQAGIGRAYIGIIGAGYSGLKPNTDIPALSEPWWENVRHAIREAGRVGVEIGFFNSPGWSQSGGPWVKPEQSMRFVVSSEIRLKGPQKFSGQLPKPPGTVQEITVLAYPSPQNDEQKVPEKERTATLVTFESAEPVTIRSVTIQPVKSVAVNADLEVSEDGQTYRKITSFPVNRSNLAVKVGPMPLAPVVVSILPTAGRSFRLKFSGACELGDIRISSALRNASVYEKQLAKMCQGALPSFDHYTWPSESASAKAGLTISGKEVRNLSSLLKPDGTLEWEVPPGEWMVQRVGMASTGTKNSPAPPEATGPEVDKINREPLKQHFDAYIGKLLASMPEQDRKAFKYVIADSYEVGSQNWTDGFAEIFRKRYGYDPLLWLPVLTGRVVESPEKSDRFLWDLRRLVADRVATEYVGGLRDLSHEKGMTLWLENYGHWGFPAEFLQYGGQSDEIGGEFWPGLNLGRVEVRCASSAAHIYGKKRVWCESYTGGPLFMNTPRDLKANGDWSFSEGINQAILHVYIHQTFERNGPGVCFPWGTEFNRHNAWWNLGMKPWIDYQRKCTVMLQAGNSVADVAYFIGEDTPKMTGIQQPALPKGYDYDYINAEVIQNRLTVKDGRLVLPEGTNYRVLVLPPSETIRPEVLRKLKALVDAGATVVGPAPKKSPSLENYPKCDQEVEALAKELWGSGKIRPVTDLQIVLTCGPDVVVPPGVAWKHRSDGNREIYFIANQENKARDEKISFRVKGKEPELWWPESGKTEPTSAFKLQGDCVEVSLHLEPLTSVFVVFEKPATASRQAPAQAWNPVTVTQAVYYAIDGAGKADVTSTVAALVAKGPFAVTYEILGSDPAYGHVKRLQVDYTANGESGSAVFGEGEEVRFHPSKIIAGPWDVQFGEKKVTLDKLMPWSEYADPDVKYYSGEAVYRKEFEVSEMKPYTVLDLGEVNAIAQIKLNGNDLGVLWKPPYRINVSKALKAGKNTLEITVVHTWHNRIIGELQPGATPTVFCSHKFGKPTDALQPSGLLGPVKLIEETSRK